MASRILRALLSTLFCLVFLSPAYGQERLSVVAHMFPSGSLPDQAAQAFSERLAAANIGGVRVVGDALLGDEQRNFRELGQDKIAFAITGDLLISSVVPSFSAVNLPFMQNSMAHSLAPFKTQKTYSRFQGLLGQYRVRHLATLCLGTRYVTANLPVRSLEDVKGLKLRLPNDRVWSAVWQTLGAETINVPFPDLPSALNSGLVAAQENPPGLIRAAKLNEVQKYLIDTQHYFQRQFILVSSSLYEATAPENQNRVTKAAQETAEDVCNRTTEAEKRDLDWLINEGGMELIKFDRKGIEATVNSVYLTQIATERDADVEALVGVQ